ncbi:MAG: DinB family protein [Syntrophobacter sp.]
MESRAKELAERLRGFNGEVIAFVERCDEQDWKKICAWEQWPVGVTARHIGAGHYSAVNLSRKIIAGEPLPQLTGEQVVEMANQHAREHAECTRRDVLDILNRNGGEMVEFVAGLDDSELDRTGYLSMLGGDVTVRQFIENVVLISGKEHLGNMKTAVGL